MLSESSPDKALSAILPRLTISSGLIMFISLYSHPRLNSISSLSGARFENRPEKPCCSLNFTGLNFTTFVMYKSCLSIPNMLKNSFKFSPAFPTKGVCLSTSCLPGASPTSTIEALGLPCPNTINWSLNLDMSLKKATQPSFSFRSSFSLSTL